MVEFKISSYQFPEKTQLQGEDSNWLNIYTNVHSNFGDWETVDPSLTTTEFNELVNWFKDLSQNKELQEPSLYFTEPNLEFSLVKNTQDSKQIRLTFSAESKPKSADVDKEYYVDFEFSNVDLSKIADELETELKKFPSRS